jgi:hypothetical protein
MAKVVGYEPRTIQRARAVHCHHQETEDNWTKIDGGMKENRGDGKKLMWSRSRKADEVRGLPLSVYEVIRNFAASDSYRATRALAGCNK